MAAHPSILVDGISTVATHNGVHRVTWFKLTSDQKPEPICELMIPASAVQGVVAALSKLR
jgi:hypothetical protein